MGKWIIIKGTTEDGEGWVVEKYSAKLWEFLLELMKDERTGPVKELVVFDMSPPSSNIELEVIELDKRAITPINIPMTSLRDNLLIQAMENADGKQNKAARALDITPQTINYRLQCLMKKGVQLPRKWVPKLSKNGNGKYD